MARMMSIGRSDQPGLVQGPRATLENSSLREESDPGGESGRAPLILIG